MAGSNGGSWENNELAIWHELTKVIEPEAGVPITDMDLVDGIKMEGSRLEVDFHCTMPEYPAYLALLLAGEIKDRLLSIPGVAQVKINLGNHILADRINRQVNEAV